MDKEKFDFLWSNTNCEKGFTGDKWGKYKEYSDTLNLSKYRHLKDIRAWIYYQDVFYFPCCKCEKITEDKERVRNYCIDCKTELRKEYQKNYTAPKTRTEYHREQMASLRAMFHYHCVVCDSEFKPLRKTAKFCGNKCKQKYYRDKEKYLGKIAHPIWTIEDEIRLNENIETHKRICAIEATSTQELDNRVKFYELYITPLKNRKAYVSRFFPEYLKHGH